MANNEKNVKFTLSLDNKDFSNKVNETKKEAINASKEIENNVQQANNNIERDSKTTAANVAQSAKNTAKQVSESAASTASKVVSQFAASEQKKRNESTKTKNKQKTNAREASDVEKRESEDAANQTKEQETKKQRLIKKTKDVATQCAKSIKSSFGSFVKSNTISFSSMFGTIRSGVSSMTRNIRTSLNSVMSKVKTTIAALAALAAYQLFQGIGGASDLDEAQNVVETAFGTYTNEANQFAKSANKIYGLTELMAKETSSSYMALGQAMGIATNNAKDMSFELTGLVGDLSSFFNKDQKEAATALKGIFTGEGEALKNFGVVMTEANLEAFRLSKNITKAYSAMSQAEKVALRYEYVMANTTLAHGDFSKTADGFANRLRVLKGNWETLLAILGSGLVQVLTPLLKTLNDIVLSLQSMAREISHALTSVFGLTQSTSTNAAAILAESVATSASDISSSVGDIEQSMEDIQNAQGGTFGFDKLNVLSDESSSSSSSTNANDTSSSVGGTTTTINTDVDTTNGENKFTKYFKWIKDRVEVIKNSFSNAFANVDLSNLSSGWDKFKKSVTQFMDFLAPVIANFAAWFAEKILPTLLEIGSVALPLIAQIIEAIDWATIGKVIEVALNIVLKLLKSISDYAKKNPEGFAKIVNAVLAIAAAMMILAPIVSVVATIISAVVGVMGALTTIAGVLGVSVGALGTAILIVIGVLAALAGVIALVVANWDSIKAFFDNVAIGAKFVCELIKNLVVALVQNAINAITNIIQFIIDRITFVINLFVMFKDMIINVLTTLKNIMLNGIKTTFNIISNLFIGFVNGIVNGFTGIRDTIAAIFNQLPDLIRSGMNAGIKFINGAISKLNGISITVPDWVPGFGGRTFGFSIPEVPELANGGVLTQPTLVKAGEYPGAKRNPEIVTPEAKMSEVVSNVMGEYMNQLIAAMMSMQQNQTTPDAINLNINGKTLMQWFRDENQKEGWRRGTNPI